MFRTGLSIIVTAIFVGCTSTQSLSTEQSNAPNIVEATALSQSPANKPLSDEEPNSQGTPANTTSPTEYTITEYPVEAGAHPHDVAPAPDGTIWYTAQHQGALGRLDPVTRATHQIPLGPGSAPHGVIVGTDGTAWITDGGQNAIVHVDPQTEEVQLFPLPANSGYTNLNTAVFDNDNNLWFTGQSGIYGRLNPSMADMQVFNAPRGRGPYGITVTPEGIVYYASLAGSYVGQINSQSNEVSILEPPTSGQGARRVWSDSQGQVWVSEWNAGQVAVYDPVNNSWREWKLPGNRPQAYAIYVDERDIIWLSDFGSNSIVRFDPTSEMFTVYELPSPNAQVRQILGRPGEIWGAESATDKLVVIRTE